MSELESAREAIDILFVAHNRKAFTVESFSALMRNTEQHGDWAKLGKIYVLDDASEDGTAEWLQDAIKRNSRRKSFVFHGERFGGPVAAMNWYLDHSADHIQTFCKIDNDFVVPPGWFSEMGKMHLLHPEIDIIGFEPMSTEGVRSCPHERTLSEAPWIGGKGFIRKRGFTYCRPQPGGKNGYGGFTEWQFKHGHVPKAWVTPDLPAFGLDQLPFEPWISLTEDYVQRGWQRNWDKYDISMAAYWDWFQPVA